MQRPGKERLLLTIALCGSVITLAATVPSKSTGATPQTEESFSSILSSFCQGAAAEGPGNFVLFGPGQAVVNCGERFSPGTSYGMPLPAAGFVSRLTAWNESGSFGEFTVFVNNSPTTVSCTVSDRFECSDAVHSVRVAGGDLVSFVVKLDDGQISNDLRVSAEFTAQPPGR